MSYDTPDANKAFKDKFDFPYDLLSDENGAVSGEYGAAGDGKATRVSVLVAPDGTVAKAYATVKPPEHPDQVLGDLP